jgi:hypothetical protein
MTEPSDIWEIAPARHLARRKKKMTRKAKRGRN